MPRKTALKKAQPLCVFLNARARVFLCAFCVLALGGAALPTNHSLVGAAHAQQTPNAATQDLFLAIDLNNLQGVRDAIDNGADIQSRDFTGTQPVDIAIDRGYFEIAQYLISVRNARQDQQQDQQQALPQAPQAPQPPQAEPDLFTIVEAVDQTPPSEITIVADAPIEQPSAVDAPSLDAARLDATDPSQERAQDIDQPPVPALPKPALPKPALELKVESEALDVEPEVLEQAESKEKPSAVKVFVSTIFDFFKPPNVTGVIHRKQAQKPQNESVSDAEIARQVEEIDAERGTEITKGPAMPMSPDELAQQRRLAPQASTDLADLKEAMASAPLGMPERSPTSVGVSQDAESLPAHDDVFADLSIENATEEDEQPLMGAVTTPAKPEPEKPTPAKMVSSSSTPGVIPPKPDYAEAPGVPGRRFDPDKPFGGGIDPDVLAYLELDPRTALPSDEVQATNTANDDPFAFLGEGEGQGEGEGSPFELLEDTDDTNVSDLLDGIDEPQDVTERTPRSPPAVDAAADDPFATPVGEDVDELAGLLESTDEDVSGTKGWDVTEVEGADLPSEVIILTDIEPTGQILDGVELTLGSDTVIGQEVGVDRLKLMEQKTIHKPCLDKGSNGTMFCIDKVSWPFELEEDFLVDTIMYQGTSAIARYDAGRASNFQTMFRSTSFEKVIGYYTQRYGHPSAIVDRAIAPLAAPRQNNPTYLWQSREPGTDTIATLEVRKFDDAQGGGFPDTLRGVILLYRSHAKAIFPQLSQLELMVLKADNLAAAEEGDNAFAPTSIWN